MCELAGAVDRVKKYISAQEDIYGETKLIKDMKIVINHVKESDEETQSPPKEELDAIVFYQNNIGMIRPFTAEEMLDWINDLGDGMVILAMKKALDQNKASWGYAKAILQAWHDKNIRTEEQVEAEETAFKNKQAKRQSFYQGQHTDTTPEWFENREHEKKANKTTEGAAGNDEERLKELMKQYRG